MLRLACSQLYSQEGSSDAASGYPYCNNWLLLFVFDARRYAQARRQEMKWGCFFVKEVEMGGVFAKKVENDGCFLRTHPTHPLPTGLIH